MSTVSNISSVNALSSLQSMLSQCSSTVSDSSDTDSTSVSSSTSSFLQAIEKALAQLGIDSSSLDSTATTDSTSTTDSTTSSASSDDVQQAAQAFMQALLAALHQAGGGNDNNLPPPPPDGVAGVNAPSYTQDQLTSMASDLSTSDSKRAELFTDLANNFDAADTNGDGKIDAQEARTFEQAKSGASSTTAYQGSGIEVDLQNLLQQLSAASNSGSSDSSDTSDLQQSFQNLVSALGGSNTTTLDSFLSALASNLEGASSSGNIVSEKV